LVSLDYLFEYCLVVVDGGFECGILEDVVFGDFDF